VAKLTTALTVFVSEINRIDAAAKGIINELYPKSATALLTEYETMLGLSYDNTLSTAERRNRIISRFRAVGGQSLAYFYSLAEALGYTTETIEIIDNTYRPFRAAASIVGTDSVYDSSAEYSIFSWRVIGTNVTTDNVLKSLFDQLKPAYTYIIYEDV
jgi:uncharacterized protein YmfQ (DUF2313 family)